MKLDLGDQLHFWYDLACNIRHPANIDAPYPHDRVYDILWSTLHTQVYAPLKTIACRSLRASIPEQPCHSYMGV